MNQYAAAQIALAARMDTARRRTRLRHSSPARARSLTGFPSFVVAARLAHGDSS